MDDTHSHNSNLCRYIVQSYANLKHNGIFCRYLHPEHPNRQFCLYITAIPTVMSLYRQQYCILTAIPAAKISQPRNTRPLTVPYCSDQLHIATHSVPPSSSGYTSSAFTTSTIAATWRSISSRSGPSAMTRINASVPDGRTKTRPLSPSAASAVATASAIAVLPG